MIISIRVSNISYRNQNTKNRPSKVGSLSSLAQKVTSCGPDGDRTRDQLTNRSTSILINKHPILGAYFLSNFYKMEGTYIHAGSAWSDTLDMVKHYLAITQTDIDSDYEKSSPVKSGNNKLF